MTSSSPFHGSDLSKGNRYDVDRSSTSTFPQSSSMLMNLFWAQWAIVTLPWQAVVYGVSCLTGLLVRFLNAAGAPPAAFRDKVKLQESQKIMEHLHQREDGFRRKLKDLQIELDSRSQECKKLEKRLGKVQSELVSKPTGRADSAQLQHADVTPPSRVDLHVLFWAAGALPAYWLLQQPNVPSISRKFVWSLIAPETLVYTFDLMGSGPPGVKKMIPALSVFLSGFVFCHWLHAHC